MIRALYVPFLNMITWQVATSEIKGSSRRIWEPEKSLLSVFFNKNRKMAFSIDVDYFMEIKCVLAIVESKSNFNFFKKQKYRSTDWESIDQSTDSETVYRKSAECIYYSY